MLHGKFVAFSNFFLRIIYHWTERFSLNEINTRQRMVLSNQKCTEYCCFGFRCKFQSQQKKIGECERDRDRETSIEEIWNFLCKINSGKRIARKTLLLFCQFQMIRVISLVYSSFIFWWLFCFEIKTRNKMCILRWLFPHHRTHSHTFRHITNNNGNIKGNNLKSNCLYEIPLDGSSWK